MSFDKSSVPRQARIKIIFDLHIVKALILVVILDFFLPSAQAVKVEFDETNSTGSVSMSVTVNAGEDSDSDSFQDTGIFYDNGISANASDTASATGSSSVSSGAYDADPEPDEDEIYTTKIFEFYLAHNFQGNPYSYENEQGDTIVIPASFSSLLNATGSVYWKLLPSNPDEKIGMPVIVEFPEFHSVGSDRTNTTYEMGIYDWEFGIEPNLFGPYKILLSSGYGWDMNMPEDNVTVFALLGDSIKLSYSILVDGHTQNPSTDSHYTRAPAGPAIRFNRYVSVKPIEVCFYDKKRRSREVDGATADGAAEIIVSIDFLDLFPDSEAPNSVKLTVLSPYGKDNGYLIEDGNDNDGDDYDDKPRISDGVFTQTWHAPATFDSIEGKDNTNKTREISIQIKMDGNNDDIYECTVIKKLSLARPPVVMVHGLWSDGSAFSELYMEFKGFMFLANPSYNNSASFLINDSVIPTWILTILDSVHQREYACSKVDIVAHSMGGLLAKRLSTNFAQENVRKIITIGTPYQGSPLADFLINDLLVNKPGLFDHLENTVFNKIAHNEQSLSGGAVHDLRCNGGIPVNAEITGVDCRGIIVGLRDGTFNPFGLIGPYLTILKIVKGQKNNEALHSSLFGTKTSDWVVSEPSQRGNATSWRTIPVSWHLTETGDADFKTLVIGWLNEPALIVPAPAMGEPLFSAETASLEFPAVQTNSSFDEISFLGTSDPNGTVEIVSPTEGQICTAGQSITYSVQGTGDTTHAAVFAFFGSSSFGDIVELPWVEDVNVPMDAIGSQAQFLAYGLDPNMNITDEDELTLVMDANAVLEDIFFGFGDKLVLDYRQLPDQPDYFHLYPLGRFSNGSEHPLSILGDSVYSSSNEAVATVDPNGLITVHSEGITDVNVINSGKSAILSIEVLMDGIFSIEINHGWDYGNGPSDELEYSFEIEIETNEDVVGVEFIVPDGNSYEIPDIDGYWDDVNGVWTEHYYDDEDGTYYWEYSTETEDINDLQKYGDGLYMIIVEYYDGSTGQTTAWFGVPDTNDPIEQPTQKPVLTFPKHRTGVNSPVTFTWEPCTDPNVSIITLDLENEDTGQEIEIDINDVNLNTHGPVDINDGYWQGELSFGQWHTVADNGDGVEVKVGKYSECHYEFAVGMPWVTYEVWAGNTDYTTEPNWWEYYYNIDKHDYVKLGESGGQTTTFLGDYNFYVIAARAEFLLDSIQELTGDYYSGGPWTGGTSDWENISGVPDGQFATIGWHGTEHTFRGFVTFSNPGSWTGLTVITDRLCGDFEPDGDVDFVDFAMFASCWLDTNCGQCDGADLVSNGNVDWEDLLKFTENWLVSR